MEICFNNLFDSFYISQPRPQQASNSEQISKLLNHNVAPSTPATRSCLAMCDPSPSQRDSNQEGQARPIQPNQPSTNAMLKFPQHNPTKLTSPHLIPITTKTKTN